MVLIKVRSAKIKQENKETEGAWHIHCALVRYAAEQPEAASNHYYQDALQESLASYRFAMGVGE